MNRETVTTYIGLLATLLTPYALTAAATDGVPPSLSAGVVERQIAREYNLQQMSPQRDIPILEVDIPEEVLNIPSGLSVYVDHIVVQRNYPLFDKQIRELTSRYTHKELHGKDVVQLCYDIQRLYADAGYILAWVYPPVQRIDNHTLTIVVLEGTLTQIEVEGNTSYKTHYIERYFSHFQGEPINYNQLMKALLLLNENANLSAQAILRKGKETGEVDLVLKVQDSRPLGLSAGYNNWGSVSTGYNQLSSTFNMGNLATSGDNLTMMTSCGVPFTFYYLNPSYSIPLTGSGANLDLSYSFNYSKTLGSAYEAFDMASWTELASITYNQPLSRTRRFQAGMNVAFNFEQYKNLQQGATVSYDRLRVLSIGGSLDYTDSLKGRNTLNPTLNIGIPDILGGSSVFDPLCTRPGGGGRYFILTLNGQRIQPLLTDCMFVITASAQGTFNKIPTSVQYVVGGMGTVRGYAASIGIGDAGYCTNFEFYIPPPFFKNRMFKPMQQTWGNILQFLAFIDHAGVYTIKAVEGELPAAYLTSVGAGFRFYGPHNFSLSFDAGFPVMHQYKQFNSILYVRLNMNFL